MYFFFYYNVRTKTLCILSREDINLVISLLVYKNYSDIILGYESVHVMEIFVFVNVIAVHFSAF
jgi:hypothetical protein